jgi:predicted amidohydrolase YtcJ
MPWKHEFTATSALVVALLLTEIVFAQSPNADLVVLHGHILTVDEKDSVAQALAIRHGTIVKVGSDTEVLNFAGNGAGIRIIDLHGRTATPGLIDTHAHIAEGGVEELYGVKLSDATTVGEILSRVKAKVAQVKSGEWITGSGWDEGKLAERR